MGIKENVDQDINAFFDQIEGQSSSDKKQSLRNLMEKYIHLTTSEYHMDERDLRKIIDRAKSIMSNKTMPVYLGQKAAEIKQEELMPMCVIESSVEYFNSKECLKRRPKFKINNPKFWEELCQCPKKQKKKYKRNFLHLQML